MILSIPSPTPLSVAQLVGRTLWSATVDRVQPTQIVTQMLWDAFWSLPTPTLCCIFVAVAVAAVLFFMWIVSMGKRLVAWALFLGGVTCYAHGSVVVGCLPCLPWYGILAAMCAWHRACEAAVSAVTGSVGTAAVSAARKAKSFVLTLLLAGAGKVRVGVRKVRFSTVNLLRSARQAPSAVLPALSKVSQAMAPVLHKACYASESIMEVVFTTVPIVDVFGVACTASFKAAVGVGAAIGNAAAAVGVAFVAAAPRAALEFAVALPRHVLWTLPCFVARSILKAVLAPILLPLAVTKYYLCSLLGSFWLVFVVVPGSFVCAVASRVR
jgi:hypothetical protein